MKLFTRIFVCSLICFFSNQLLAADPIQCPSVDTVKLKSIFVRAKNFYDDVWMMRTDHFRDNNHNWDILFGVILPEANSAEQALERGQLYFQQNVVLSEPKIENSGQFTGCFYSDRNNEEYIVFAASPPLNLPSFPTYAKWLGRK